MNSINTARFRQHFPNRHVILPVIHVDSIEQALRNTEIARSAGADGAFLINHYMGDDELLSIHTEVAAHHPDWWLGVNCLGLSAAQASERVSDSVSGIWADNAEIDEGQSAQPAAEEIQAVQKRRAWRGLYFGGVAFKYQRSVKDLAAACQIAANYMDVVTTSGPGTGHAADLEKIRVMKQALGTQPLAIASGITAENVSDYLPIADAFLVATGVSKSFTELDPAKVLELVKRVRDAN